MNYDFLIVGSGFFGSVIAERLSNELKKKVLIIEKRNHIGGNCFSEIDKKTGIEFHKYGTHIFHTSNEKVWKYINQFTKFNSYRHQVLANYQKKIYQLPINLETINSFYNKSLNPIQAKNFIKSEIKKNKILKPKNFEEKAISLIGKKLYNAFIKGYTTKHWGVNPKQLPSSIISRLPIRFNYNEDYFNHCRWQGIPVHGYTEIFSKLLNNTNIKLRLNEEFKIEKYKKNIPVLYTGPLDKLFNYKFGKLEWRSVSFKKTYHNCDDYQGNSVINYSEKHIPFTRIHEPKHLHPEKKILKTLTFAEFPQENIDEPYYPINNNLNRHLYKKYKSEIVKNKNFFVGGRLADYAYYDMDMTISAALQLYYKKIKAIF